MSGEPGHAAPLTLDGVSLTLGDVERVARDPRIQVEVAPEAMARVEAARRHIENIAETYEREFETYERGESEEPPVQEYGVTTGFGEFKDVPVAPAELERLQRNILLSHSVGVGESADRDRPENHFSAEAVRATLLIRLNAFLRGHSGVRREVAEAVRAMLNRGIVPQVPQRGSVGSSGDLCPLAHLFAVFLGAGRYWTVRDPEETRAAPGKLTPATELAADLGSEPPSPSFKEGLALVNGATVSAGVLALAVADVARLASMADVAAALSLEAACGCARALDPRVHSARGQRGQEDSARNIRRLVEGSRLVDAAATSVQDPYSLRAAPVVHGASRDTLGYAAMVAEREINAATDNPLFFPGDLGGDGPSWDASFRANWPDGYRGEARSSFSAANFHGQPVALAADFLAIAVAELADVSERRGQVLLDHHHSRGLPAGLVANPGLNTGLMIAQYCAAGLVSENKVLTHPASVDSIPTSSNVEDHNSMATIAARKLRTVIANAQATLAIELLLAAQAVEWRLAAGRMPGGSGAEEEVRFDEVTAPERRAEIAAGLGKGTGAAYLAIRERVAPLVEDRTLDEDVRQIRRALEDGSLEAAVEGALGKRLEPVPTLGSP